MKVKTVPISTPDAGAVQYPSGLFSSVKFTDRTGQLLMTDYSGVPHFAVVTLSETAKHGAEHWLIAPPPRLPAIIHENEFSAGKSRFKLVGPDDDIWNFIALKATDVLKKLKSENCSAISSDIERLQNALGETVAAKRNLTAAYWIRFNFNKNEFLRGAVHAMEQNEIYPSDTRRAQTLMFYAIDLYFQELCKTAYCRPLIPPAS